MLENWKESKEGEQLQSWWIFVPKRAGGQSYWLTYARRLDGDHWTDPVEAAHSDGLLDETAAVLPHPSGGGVLVHNTDGRFTTPNKIQNMVYVSYLDLPGEPVEPNNVRASRRDTPSHSNPPPMRTK